MRPVFYNPATAPTPNMICLPNFSSANGTKILFFIVFLVLMFSVQFAYNGGLLFGKVRWH